MEIKDVILGFLDWKPMTGYELKKMFEEFDFLPWSGNNNQIYKALLEMEKEKLVSKTIIQQENLPAQKRYSLTRAGRDQLQVSVSQPPAAQGLQIRSNFLLQMAWSGCLTSQETTQLVGLYQKQVEKELQACQDQVKAKAIAIRRNPREEFIWGMIFRNRIIHLQSELNWLGLMQNGLAKLSDRRYL